MIDHIHVTYLCSNECEARSQQRLLFAAKDVASFGERLVQTIRVWGNEVANWV